VDSGTIFKIDASGGETILYSFTSRLGPDGNLARAQLFSGMTSTPGFQLIFGNPTKS